jgi:hypothetical protein
MWLLQEISFQNSVSLFYEAKSNVQVFTLTIYFLFQYRFCVNYMHSFNFHLVFVNESCYKFVCTCRVVQGDQMGLWKKSPKIKPNPFSSKLINT